MLTLYHNDMSSCAQKVRLMLAEKGLAWESRHLNLRAGEHQQDWYIKLNPRAVVSLRQGMTRDQVQLLLGTPLLRDAFHADRWDYTFNTSRNGIIKEQSNLTLYFENDVLARAEGDAIQKSIEAVQAGQNIVPTTETKPQ